MLGQQPVETTRSGEGERRERRNGAFAKHSILFKVKEDEDFSRRNTLSILRTKI